MCYHYCTGELGAVGTGWGVGWGPGDQTCRLTILSPAADWFMSLGVGLLTFASLETVGIYFGLGKSPPTHRCSEVGGWTS